MNDQERIYSAIFTATAGAASLLNLIIFASTARKLQNLAPTSLILIFLCCSDGLTATVGFIINSISLNRNEVIDRYPVSSLSNVTICHVHGFFQIFGGSSSLLLCLGLTLLRYTIITHHYNPSKMVAPLYILIVYILSSFIASLPFLTGSYSQTYGLHPSKVYCCTQWNQRDVGSKIVIGINFATIIPPVTVIGYAYLRIYLEMSTSVTAFTDAVCSNKRSSISGYGVAEEEDSSFKASRASEAVTVVKKRAEEDQMKLLKESVAIVFPFVVGWTPYLILMVYETWTGELVSPLMDFLAIYFTVLNEAVNPIISVIFNGEIQSSGVASTCNLLIVLSSSQRLKTLSPTSYLTYFLCFSDSIVATTEFTIGLLSTLQHSSSTASEPIIPCQIHAFLQVFPCSTSLLLCLGLTYFRYAVIITETHLTTSFARRYTLSCFALCILIASLPFLVGSSTRTYTLQPSRLYCATAWYSRDLKTLGLIAVNIVTLRRSVVELRTSDTSCSKEGSGKRELSSCGGGGGGGGGVGASETRLNLKESKQSLVEVSAATTAPGAAGNTTQTSRVSITTKRAEKEQRVLLNQSLVIVLSFLLGWLPYLTLMITELVTAEPVSPGYDFLAFYFTVLVEATNPIIVLSFNKELREHAFKMLWLK
ncbi:hypothetical protein BDR26DRAFT_935180 [Obelidium mucronatum]|nr:hypothetical protein BDR26DRAFT_935180 [Obelidium mucronatum]